MAHVLIVEDEPDLQEAFRGYLDLLGHTCDLARDGREAMELVLHAEFEYDLMLIDLYLPRMTGNEFLSGVSDLVRRRTPLVVISGRDDMVDDLGALRARLSSILIKPVDREAFDQVVARGLDQRATYRHMTGLEERGAELQRRLDILVRKNEELYNQARIDELTKLPNRRRLMEDLRALDANRRRYKTPFALALCDVDDFGRYNKEHSLAVGDRALTLVAQTIRDACREGDALYRFGKAWGEPAYRFGGDEFVLVLAAQDLTRAVQTVERLRLAVASAGADDQCGVPGPPVTMSVGVVSHDAKEDLTVEAMLAEANELLRQAKTEGGNCVLPALRISAERGPRPTT